MTKYTMDKKLIHTKNSFERYLNTLSLGDAKFNNIEPEIIAVYFITDKFGTNLRKKDKQQYDRLYLIWLNTK